MHIQMNSVRAIAGALLLGAIAPLHGQDPSTELRTGYPAKPVRIIVPLAPGGVADLLSRVIAQKLTVTGKQPVIVDNRPGGGGIIGAEIAARTAPDGYTLFTGFHATQAVLPHLYAKLPYDPVKDFDPIILMAIVPNVLVVHPSLPVRSVKELVALGRSRRGSLTYASQGIGSTGHIAGELFRLTTKVDIVHIPYKGAGPATTDLIGGHVMMMFDVATLALPNARAGKVRALAVLTPERIPVASDLPTMAEAGVAGVEGGPWFALFAPAKTPRAVVDWWNRETRRVFSDPEARERFVSQGATMPLGTPEALGAFVDAETQRWGRVIRTAGIRIE